jgi:acetyl-CoA carboxylase beta subunit
MSLPTVSEATNRQHAYGDDFQQGEDLQPGGLGDGYVEQIRKRLTFARLNVLERSARFEEFLISC